MKVVDKATGEVIELTFDNPAMLAQRYFEVSQRIQALERMKEKLRDEVIKVLGEDDSFEASHKFRFVRQHRTTKQYDQVVLRKYLSEDQLQDVLKPDTKITATLLDELVKHKELFPDEKKEIESQMLITGGYDAIKVEQLTRSKA